MAKDDSRYAPFRTRQREYFLWRLPAALLAVVLWIATGRWWAVAGVLAIAAVGLAVEARRKR